MKRVISSIILSVMVLSMSNVAYAADTTTTYSEPQLNEILQEKGFPAKTLSELDTQSKERFASKEEIVYGGEQTYFFDLNENDELVPIVPTRGQIPGADLKLTGIYAKGVENGNVTTVYYTFRYQWYTIPVNRYQDPIGLTFNPELLRFRIGSFEKRDNYVINGHSVNHSTEYNCADYSPEGLGWYADLVGIPYAPTSLSGVGEFELEPIPGTTIKNGTGWTSRMYGKYGHVKTPLSANFSFSYNGAGGGINFGLPSDNDTLGFIFDIRF